MKRREFITLLGGAAAAWPLGARAQQGERMRRLGVLRSADAGDPKGKAQLFAFTEELAVLGWADGPNLRMEIRWGGGNVNRASVFAKELVALQPDVILSQGTRPFWLTRNGSRPCRLGSPKFRSSPPVNRY